MNWAWDEEKNKANKRKHDLGFELAQFVFTDPLMLTRLDPNSEEERYQTIGLVGHITIFVVHTWSDSKSRADEKFGRIISARKATNYERETYEEGTF